MFVFPGQGSQWAGMGAALAASPAFAAALAECSDALAPGRGLVAAGRAARRAGAPSTAVDVVQPVLFAVMVALAAAVAVVRRRAGRRRRPLPGRDRRRPRRRRAVARGRRPGRGLRSRALIRRCAGRGSMMAVALPAADGRARLERFGGRLSVAAVNGPRLCRVSGDAAPWTSCVEGWSRTGSGPAGSRVDYAAHSAEVDPFRDDLLGRLARIAPARRGGPVRLHRHRRRAGHHRAERRLLVPQPARRRSASTPPSRALLAAGHRAFVEVSPHPVLPSARSTTAEDPGVEAPSLGTLRRDDGGLDAVPDLRWPRLYARGAAVDWTARSPAAGPAGRPADLPLPAQRYWLRRRPRTGDAGRRPAAADHPLLGAARADRGRRGSAAHRAPVARRPPVARDHAVGAPCSSPARVCWNWWPRQMPNTGTLPTHLAHRVDDVAERRRVAGAVGEEDGVGRRGRAAPPRTSCRGAARAARRARAGCGRSSP